MPRTGILLAIVALFMRSSLALSPEEWPDCANPEYESQAKQNVCAGRRYEAADTALNRQYQETLRPLPEGSRRKLVREQREWLKKLKPHCEELVGPRQEAGNMWEMEFNDCLAQETEARTKALRRWKPKP